MNRYIESFILGAVLFGILWLLGLFVSWIDYSVNKSLIDAIKFTQFEWWHWMTYRHFWTWLYVYDFEAYLTISLIICILLGIIFALYWISREWN